MVTKPYPASFLSVFLASQEGLEKRLRLQMAEGERAGMEKRRDAQFCSEKFFATGELEFFDKNGKVYLGKKITNDAGV